MRILLNYYYLIIVIIIINNSIWVFCQRNYSELIKVPTKFTAKDQQIKPHSELPLVKDEVSITLRINIEVHNTDNNKFSTIFHKGIYILHMRYLLRKALWL